MAKEHQAYPQIINLFIKNRLKLINGQVYLDDKKFLNSGLIFKTKINLKTSILFIILSLNSEINAFELKPYEAKYLASKFGLEITGTRKLEKIDTNKYKISMKTNFYGLSYMNQVNLF